jgi:hypothetical protein
MNDFSASDAALEGFQVLRKDWRIVVGWCLFSVMAFVALLIVAFIAITFSTLAATSRDQATAVGGVIGGVVLGLGGVMVEVAVTVALYRLMLRPQTKPELFYLRISRAEGRLMGLWMVVLAALGALSGAAFFAVRSLAHLGGVAAGVGGVAFLALLLWLTLRFSLAGPANFDNGGLGLVQSWRLTRGRVWPLAGTWLLSFCLLALIAVVLWLATALLQAAIGGFHSLAPVDLSDREALSERPGAYIFGFLAELALGPVFWVISQAPYAAIYRRLAAPDAQEA